MLSDSEFTTWLAALDAPARSTELASLIGESAGKLRAQRLRSRVSWSTVVAVSRALGRSPLADLRTFATFANVDAGAGPTQRETLSQVQAEDVLLEIAKRRRSQIAAIVGASDYELQAFPFDESTRYWFDAIDTDGSLRSKVIDASTLDKTGLSRAIRNNSLSPEVTVLAASIAGGTPSVGLVLNGLLTAAEAGWSAGSRATALLECSDAELIELARIRLRTLSRQVDAELEETLYWKTLG